MYSIDILKGVIFCLAIIYSVFIFLAKDIDKIKLTLFGLIFFDLGISILPIFNPLDRLWFLSLFLSLLFRHQNRINEIKKNPYLIYIFIFAFIILLLSLFDSRNSLIKNLIRSLLYVIDYFGIFLILGVFVKNKRDIIKVLNFYYYCMLICSVYTLIVLLFRENFYYNFFSNTYNLSNVSNDFLTRERMGVSSFIPHPHTNGLYISYAILIRIFLSNYANWKITLNHIIFLLMMIFSQILCNSRTVYLAFIIGLFVYSLYGITKKWKIILYSGLLIYVFFTYFFVRIPSQYFIQISINNGYLSGSKAIDMKEIIDKESVYGSSLEMRKEQLINSFKLVKENIFIGNGLRWLKEDFGFNPNDKSYKMKIGFYNFESFLYITLIENGILGITAWGMMYIRIIQCNIKRLSNFKLDSETRQLFSIILAIFAVYIIFIYLIGEIHTTVLSFALISLLTKAQLIKDNEITESRI